MGASSAVARTVIEALYSVRNQNFITRKSRDANRRITTSRHLTPDFRLQEEGV